MPTAVSVHPRARMLRASAVRAPAMITASTAPSEPRPQPPRPLREFEVAEKLAEDEVDSELGVVVRPSESIFTGRWVDPGKPRREEASFGTVVRTALATLDEYRREGRLNSTRFSQEWTRYLAKLDRGDFRWEFLTPWRTEPLTVRDKAIVCISFISGALIAQELWDPEASFWDHLSYLVFFFAYAIANNATLRQLAILGSTFEIFAFLFDDAGPERAEIVPVSYELLFIVINSYYALRAYIAEQPVELEDVERRVYEACFQPTGLTPRQFVKLLERAEWHVSVDGSLLCEQGEPVKDAFVPLSGNFSIVTAERGRVASIGLFNLVGEVSLLENLQSEGGRFHKAAIASMVAEPGSTYVRWPQKAFYELMQADADFASAMQLMISKTLSKKLLALWETSSADEPRQFRLSPAGQEPGPAGSTSDRARAPEAAGESSPPA